MLTRQFSFTKVYRGDPEREQDSIIGFYNKVYMIAMKSTILQFAPNKVSQISRLGCLCYPLSPKNDLIKHQGYENKGNDHRR